MYFHFWKKAIDIGGKISENLTFEINIMDVNDQFPIFTYPKPNQMIFINEVKYTVFLKRIVRL